MLTFINFNIDQMMPIIRFLTVDHRAALKKDRLRNE